MKRQDTIGQILKGSASCGTFSLPELIRYAQEGRISGIAVSKESGKEIYLAFIRGGAEGAIYADEKGELYGDKAVIRITGGEKFELFRIPEDLVEPVVMGSRIFEKSHLEKSGIGMMPEIGRKSSGIGHLLLVVRVGGRARNGIRVSLRKDGKIVGSDITVRDGSAGFRLLLGDYECIVQERDQAFRSFPVRFNEDNQIIFLDL